MRIVIEWSSAANATPGTTASAWALMMITAGNVTARI